MDFVFPTFPLHQGDELLFQISSNPCQQDTISQDTPLMDSSLEGSDLSFKLDKNQYPVLTASVDGNDEGTNNDKKMKKVMHRNVERQRRQEMANLYSSLRSQLPHEYLRGKRSISDHMNEAASYIKYLQKNIQELSDKRDGLRKKHNSRAPEVTSGQSSHGCPPDRVMVHRCLDGVEVVISSSLTDHGVLPLSTVLEVLVEEGFSIVKCVSTKVKEVLLHTIQSKASDQICVDISALQQKLSDLFQTSSRIPM